MGATVDTHISTSTRMGTNTNMEMGRESWPRTFRLPRLARLTATTIMSMGMDMITRTLDMALRGKNTIIRMMVIRMADMGIPMGV